MRTYLLGLFCLLHLSLAAHGPVDYNKGIKWMTWQEAIKAAEKAHQSGQVPKKFLVNIYTDWCKWCKRLDIETFGNKELAAYVNANYYPIRFNAETHETIIINGYSFRYVPFAGQANKGINELAYLLQEGVIQYPTVVFLDIDFSILQRLDRFVDSETMLAVTNYINSDDYYLIPWVFYWEDWVNMRAYNNHRNSGNGTNFVKGK